MFTCRFVLVILAAFSFQALLGAEKATKPNTRVNAKDGQTYVWIPAGTFEMGCLPPDTLCYTWEMAPKEERIEKGFWIGKTEVTQKAYFAVMNQNPSLYQYNGERRPVEQVTWEYAKAYCQAVGGRLPTELEWEYVARAGTKSPYYGKLPDIAWYEINTAERTGEVARKDANAFGVYDMIGNVWEWTEDLFGDHGDLRVLRGGSFLSDERDLRVSNRAWAEPYAALKMQGFRCVTEESEP